jgi:uncharacterized protein YggT (Ycf19 family)
MPLAITRDDAANYVAALAAIYFVLIFIRILLSWITLPYHRWLRAATDFVTDVTDPYLGLFRRFLPLVRLGPGALDLSPIVAIFVLFIVAGLVERLIRG